MPMLMTLRMRLPVWPFHCAAADAVGEVGHAVEDGVDLGDDVLAIDDDRGVARGAQGDVEDGAVFGDVDLLAGEHGVDALARLRLVGEVDEQTEGLVGDAVFGVVEVDAGGVDGRGVRRGWGHRRRVSAGGRGRADRGGFRGLSRRGGLWGCRSWGVLL